MELNTWRDICRRNTWIADHPFEILKNWILSVFAGSALHMFSVHMSGSVQCTVHSAHVCWKRKTVAHFWEDKQPENWKVNRIRLEEGLTQPWNVRNVFAPGSHFARLSVSGCSSKQRSGIFECILPRIKQTVSLLLYFAHCSSAQITFHPSFGQLGHPVVMYWPHQQVCSLIL